MHYNTNVPSAAVHLLDPIYIVHPCIYVRRLLTPHFATFKSSKGQGKTTNPKPPNATQKRGGGSLVLGTAGGPTGARTGSHTCELLALKQN